MQIEREREKDIHTYDIYRNNNSKYMEKHTHTYIYIYIYTCKEMYCQCAKLDLNKRAGGGLGGEAQFLPQSRMTIPVFTGNAVV